MKIKTYYRKTLLILRNANWYVALRAIIEQEMPRKLTNNKRNHDVQKKSTCNGKCRLCHTAIDFVTYRVCVWPEILSDTICKCYWMR